MIRPREIRVVTTEGRTQDVVYAGLRRSPEELDALQLAWERGDVDPNMPAPDEVTVTVHVYGGPRSPLRHVVHHSPSGFEWGYAGSGPHDLALSILADFFEEDPTDVVQSLRNGTARPTRAAALHHAFVQIIATIGNGPGHSSRWELSGLDLRFWLAHNSRALAQQQAYAERLQTWEELQSIDAMIVELERAERESES